MAAVAQPGASTDFSGGGGGDTDCETQPPSDCDRSMLDHPKGIPTPAASVLKQMELVNKCNEQDSRSVTSVKSGGEGSSGSNGGGKQNGLPDSPNSSKRPSAQPDDTDEDLDLWAVWGALVKNWEVEYRKRPVYIKDLVRRGIPCHFRTIAWQLLSGANSAAIHDLYAEYMRIGSPYEKVIQRDIPRTYPELDFFKDGGRGQNALFNVIKAYSVHDEEVGYCQGSAFIVGQLLMQMPEEEAFAVFTKLMEDFRMRELYKPAMTELGLCMFQLECLIQEQMPDLYSHFNNMGFDTSMYASSWFLTLFTTTLPLELANRVMDVFLVDGMEAIFRFAMVILRLARVELLSLDMEGMLKYFQRDVRQLFELDTELLFAISSNVILNPKKMKRLEKDYMAKRTKEQEEAIELRRLRTENRLLRQRIEYLEQESGALADRLIRGQVNLAQEAENCISINHELHKLRDINSDAHRRLEDAYETIRELSCKKNSDKRDQPVQVDDKTMIEHIHALQQELIETHAREADNENTIRDLKQRVQELEAANKRLRETPPDHCIASLQEELISVKMREAEASLSLKEMRQRLQELETHWAKYIHSRCFNQPTNSRSLDSGKDQIGQPGPENSPENGALEQSANQKQPNQPSPPQTTTSNTTGQKGRFFRIPPLANATSWITGGGGSVDHNGDAHNNDTNTNNNNNNNSSSAIKEMEDQLMGVRIREADMAAELKEMRQKVMELETQNHVCTNQLKRQDLELKQSREERDQVELKHRELTDKLREEERKVIEVNSQLKEKEVLERLRNTESDLLIADLKQRVNELELKKHEQWTHSQLRGGSVSGLDDDSNSQYSRTQSIISGDRVSITSEQSTGDFNDLLNDVTVRLPGETESEAAEEDDTETDDSPRTVVDAQTSLSTTTASSAHKTVHKTESASADDSSTVTTSTATNSST